MGYRVNEVFLSLQGEGKRAGTLNVFLRLSGCNLTCKVETHGFDCDTEFTSGRTMSLDELMAEVVKVARGCKNVILTGGEPLLQVDDALLEALKAAGFYIAVETNGTKPVPELVDWITLSPKVAEHAVAVKRASEVKYVRRHGQGIPKPSAKADHYLISPAFSAVGFGSKDMNWCIELIRQHPKWALSLQMHKVWSVR